LKYASDPQIVRLLAEGMRQFHAIPVEACPFDRRYSTILQEAEQRTRHRIIDESNFDEFFSHAGQGKLTLSSN
jgi:aminoglycoside phosphotransferase